MNGESRASGFLALAERRHSVLRYDSRPIEEETLEAVLRAGQLAPTACNNQPQRILLLTEEEKLALIRRVTRCSLPFAAAMLVCFDRDSCWYRPCDGRSSGETDAAIVTTHMMLADADLGLGSIWVMSWDPREMREAFAIPARWEPTALLILGYEAAGALPNPGHFSRRPLGETVFRNSFD